MLKAVKFVSIPVKDQAKALKFYTEQLGLTLLTNQPFDDNQNWIELQIPGAETRITLFTPSGHEDRIGTFSNITFSSANVQKSYEDLSARGVEFVKPPTKEHWGTFAMFKDIDGNMFVLSSK